MLHRDNANLTVEGARPLSESLEALFALKHEMLPQLREAPYVVEDLPVVCAWYPTAGTAALWNLSEQPQQFTVAFKQQTHTAETAGLGMTLVEGLA